MDIEYATICKAIEVGGFEQLAAAGVTHRYFLDEGNLDVFHWMHDHWTRFGASPGMDAYRHEYPMDGMIDTPEPLEYYIQELRDQYRYALVTGILDQVRDPLRNGDTDIAVKVLASGLENMHLEVVELLDRNLTKTGDERMARFDLLTQHRGGLLGAPTSFPSMDLATGGLQKQQLVTLIGLPKSMKSMLLMVMNIAAHDAGYRTLFASFEMTNDEQETRHDALRSKVSLTRLQHGKFGDMERQRIQRVHHAMEDMQDMILVHDPAGTTTVSALAAKISLHRPDIVFVDGAYLMDNEIGADPSSPQALTSLTRSLKRLAQRFDIPIVQTTQALSWKTRKGKLTLDSIGYSSSFAQDSDVIFGVELDPDPDKIEVKLRIIASRNCPRKDVMLTVNLDVGQINETEEVTYGSDDEPDEEDFEA